MFQLGVICQDVFGEFVCLFDDVGVVGKVGQLQVGNFVLLGVVNFVGVVQFEVGFGNDKVVGVVFDDFQVFVGFQGCFFGNYYVVVLEVVVFDLFV